jgi:hypothetical protein
MQMTKRFEIEVEIEDKNGNPYFRTYDVRAKNAFIARKILERQLDGNAWYTVTHVQLRKE